MEPPTVSAVGAYLDFSYPHAATKATVFTQHIPLNKCYLNKQKGKIRSHFFSPFNFFFQTKLVLLLRNLPEMVKTFMWEIRTFRTLSLSCSDFFPPLSLKSNSPCAPWMNSNIWTETFRVQRDPGKSMSSLNALKKRNSHRSGKARLLFKSFA